MLDGVRDSKQMTPRQRERYEGCIKSVSIAWAVGRRPKARLTQLGIVPATRLAMQRALEQLVYPPESPAAGLHLPARLRLPADRRWSRATAAR